MNKIKKMALSTIIGILSITLISCGTINFKSYTEINKDGSGTIKFQAVYDDVVSSFAEKDLFDKDWAKNSGYILNKYSKDNMNVEELTYNFKSIDELKQKVKSSDFATITYDKKFGILKDTYSINIKINKSLINELNTEAKEKGDESGSSSSGISYIKNIQVSNQIKVPGTILNSNATYKIDTNTVQWDYKLGQIDESTNVSLTFQGEKKTYLAVGGSILILLLCGIAIYKYKKK